MKARELVGTLGQARIWHEVGHPGLQVSAIRAGCSPGWTERVAAGYWPPGAMSPVVGELGAAE